MSLTSSILVLISPLIIWFSCGSALANEDSSLVGKKAPAFELKSLQGKSFSLAKMTSQNEVTVLNFWATWCTACLAEFPEVDKLAKAMAPQKVQVYTINVEEKATDVSRTIKDLKISFPILLDLNGAVKNSYKLTAIPATFLVDKNGVIRAEILGTINAAQLESKIKQILNSK